MPYSGGQPLHVSELELPDHPGSKEVCGMKKNIYSYLDRSLAHELITRERIKKLNKKEIILF
jgi:hypothetical protein